ncbi:hypothetical protein HDU76_002124, partial [Blyttiomyces sp. JEL0837]
MNILVESVATLGNIMIRSLSRDLGKAEFLDDENLEKQSLPVTPSPLSPRSKDKHLFGISGSPSKREVAVPGGHLGMTRAFSADAVAEESLRAGTESGALINAAERAGTVATEVGGACDVGYNVNVGEELGGEAKTEALNLNDWTHLFSITESIGPVIVSVNPDINKALVRTKFAFDEQPINAMDPTEAAKGALIRHLQHHLFNLAKEVISFHNLDCGSGSGGLRKELTEDDCLKLARVLCGVVLVQFEKGIRVDSDEVWGYARELFVAGLEESVDFNKNDQILIDVVTSPEEMEAHDSRVRSIFGASVQEYFPFKRGKSSNTVLESIFVDGLDSNDHFRMPNRPNTHHTLNINSIIMEFLMTEEIFAKQMEAYQKLVQIVELEKENDKNFLSRHIIKACFVKVDELKSASERFIARMREIMNSPDQIKSLMICFESHVDAVTPLMVSYRQGENFSLGRCETYLNGMDPDSMKFQKVLQKAYAQVWKELKVNADLLTLRNHPTRRPSQYVTMIKTLLESVPKTDSASPHIESAASKLHTLVRAVEDATDQCTPQTYLLSLYNLIENKSAYPYLVNTSRVFLNSYQVKVLGVTSWNGTTTTVSGFASDEVALVLLNDMMLVISRMSDKADLFAVRGKCKLERVILLDKLVIMEHAGNDIILGVRSSPSKIPVPGSRTPKLDPLDREIQSLDTDLKHAVHAGILGRFDEVMKFSVSSGKQTMLQEIRHAMFCQSVAESYSGSIEKRTECHVRNRQGTSLYSRFVSNTKVTTSQAQKHSQAKASACVVFHCEKGRALELLRCHGDDYDTIAILLQSKIQPYFTWIVRGRPKSSLDNFAEARKPSIPLNQTTQVLGGEDTAIQALFKAAGSHFSPPSTTSILRTTQLRELHLTSLVNLIPPIVKRARRQSVISQISFFSSRHSRSMSRSSIISTQSSISYRSQYDMGEGSIRGSMDGAALDSKIPVDLPFADVKTQRNSMWNSMMKKAGSSSLRKIMRAINDAGGFNAFDPAFNRGKSLDGRAADFDSSLHRSATLMGRGSPKKATVLKRTDSLRIAGRNKLPTEGVERLKQFFEDKPDAIFSSSLQYHFLQFSQYKKNLTVPSLKQYWQQNVVRSKESGDNAMTLFSALHQFYKNGANVEHLTAFFKPILFGSQHALTLPSYVTSDLISFLIINYPQIGSLDPKIMADLKASSPSKMPRPVENTLRRREVTRDEITFPPPSPERQVQANPIVKPLQRNESESSEYQTPLSGSIEEMVPPTPSLPTVEIFVKEPSILDLSVFTAAPTTSARHDYLVSLESQDNASAEVKKPVDDEPVAEPKIALLNETLYFAEPEVHPLSDILQNETNIGTTESAIAELRLQNPDSIAPSLRANQEDNVALTNEPCEVMNETKTNELTITAPEIMEAPQPNFNASMETPPMLIETLPVVSTISESTLDIGSFDDQLPSFVFESQTETTVEQVLDLNVNPGTNAKEEVKSSDVDATMLEATTVVHSTSSMTELIHSSTTGELSLMDSIMSEFALLSAARNEVDLRRQQFTVEEDLLVTVSGESETEEVTNVVSEEPLAISLAEETQTDKATDIVYRVSTPVLCEDNLGNPQADETQIEEAADETPMEDAVHVKQNLENVQSGQSLEPTHVFCEGPYEGSVIPTCETREAQVSPQGCGVVCDPSSARKELDKIHYNDACDIGEHVEEQRSNDVEIVDTA